MKTIRPRPAALVVALCLAAATPAFAQLSLNFNVPGASIGVNLGGYPALQQVPGYPVYYAPGLSQNYFFYDGNYWLYQNDNWYASTWYNGPWGRVDPMDVPLYVLRVPVRYYRHPPTYFRGWRADAPPRWDQHWGRSWTDRHAGWDRWDRRSAPQPAPLPAYQREYRGNRYPDASRQAEMHSQYNNGRNNGNETHFARPSNENPQRANRPNEQAQQQHFNRPQPAQPVQHAQPVNAQPNDSRRNGSQQAREAVAGQQEQARQHQQPAAQTSRPGNSIPVPTRDGQNKDRNGNAHDAGGATRDPNHSGG